MKKSITTILKTFCAFMLLFTLVLVINSVTVSADSGETVRVSTSSELKKALKNSNVGTIIFKTPATLSVKISATNASKGKSLVIDAPNVTFTNKAVFSDINILSVYSFTEAASGNNITVSDDTKIRELVIAKKKKLNSLTVFSTLDHYSINYYLRKSAKINNIEFIYAGGTEPVKSSYNSKTRVISMKYTNEYGIGVSLKYNLDKSGRIIKEISEHPETGYEYNYTFDGDGYVTAIKGKDNTGDFSITYTYTPDKKVSKSIRSFENGSGDSTTTYEYDKKGRRISQKLFMDSSKNAAEDYTFEYDSKGRMVKSVGLFPAYGYNAEYRYTYNSKGFITQYVEEYSGEYYGDTVVTHITTYKYNKAGDLVKQTYSLDDEVYVTEYTYDKYGELVETKHTSPDGSVYVE